MTRTVALVHGWGFDASLWDGVRPLLGDDVAVTAVDLGFFGRPRLEMPPVVDLAVGHSLGVLWLLTKARGRWRRLAAVNGFPRFTAAADFPHGTPARVVERMQSRLTAQPREVLDAFRARCGAGPATAEPDPARLAWGLDLLRSGDGRAALPAATVALAGADDPIVSAVMTQAAFPLVSLRPGGHLLPITDPAAVAAFIREALPDHE